MIFVDAIFVVFCGSLLFQTASSLANASNQVVSNKTPDVSPSTKCHNVHFNNYYSGPPNKDIKAHLLKIENQLADTQNVMTGNKTVHPGKCPSLTVSTIQVLLYSLDAMHVLRKFYYLFS